MPEKKMGEVGRISEDLAQSIRLGLKSEVDGMRLFAARLVRKYRQGAPELARQIDEYLRATPATSPMRKRSLTEPYADAASDRDGEDALAFLRVETAGAVPPILSDAVKMPIRQLLAERRQAKKLQSLGFEPMKSAIFVGAPGVGKTMTARWIAAELNLPLLVLDLATIMSRFLGKTGNNLRDVFSHARGAPCILFLDEIDAIAKRRSDLSDVGELKRLVTVMLQEIDVWPSSSLLLAATNHVDLIDPALWRRFDLTVEFPPPEKRLIVETLQRLLSDERGRFERWLPIMSLLFEGQSFSDIDRTVTQFRKAVTLKTASPEELVESLVRRHTAELDRADRQEMARHLVALTRFSQHAISDITGVSRDTIRKYQKQEDLGNGN